MPSDGLIQNKARQYELDEEW
eukprot:COSAG02_NODE_17837_length_977_cov_0.864465_1_plen_20_part_10